MKRDYVINQDGEEIKTSGISRREDGIWESWALNCFSSAGLGLGTCGCHSHNPWDVRPASLEELAQEGITLTAEERFNQLLAIAGVTLPDLEEFCRLSYRLDSNPLPKLRALLPGFQVNFMHQDELRLSSWDHEPAHWDFGNFYGSGQAARLQSEVRDRARAQEICRERYSAVVAGWKGGEFLGADMRVEDLRSFDAGEIGSLDPGDGPEIVVELCDMRDSDGTLTVWIETYLD